MTSCSNPVALPPRQRSTCCTKKWSVKRSSKTCRPHLNVIVRISPRNLSRGDDWPLFQRQPCSTLGQAQSPEPRSVTDCRVATMGSGNLRRISYTSSRLYLHQSALKHSLTHPPARTPDARLLLEQEIGPFFLTAKQTKPIRWTPLATT